MFVIIQRAIHVTTDMLLEVKQYEDDSNDDAEFFDTFIIEHEAIGNGIFTVSVSPYSYDQESIMCEAPSKFTVDYEALQDIYKDPAKFILDQVVKYDERYSLSDDTDHSKDIISDMNLPEINMSDVNIKPISISDMFKLDHMPAGCNVVSYSNKDGEVTDVIIYSDDPKFTFTDEQKMKFDEIYGVGKYKIMDTKEARRYIKQKEKALDKENEEYCKAHPDEAKNFNPFDIFFR